MNIGKSIKVALAKAGKDPKWLAKEMKVHTQGIYNLMKQESCQLTTVDRVATAFGIKSTELLELGEGTLGDDQGGE